MPTWPNAAAFAADLERAQREIERDEAKKINAESAREAQVIAYREAAKDLGGDPKFSGWRPWLKLDIKQKRDGSLLRPTRTSAGPWTVANVGRNKGNASGFAGPGINRRTGLTSRTKSGNVRKVRTFNSRTRWNGYTAGFGTANRAVRVMDEKIPDGVEKRFGKVLRRRFDVN